jgi:hypothetical protein
MWVWFSRSCRYWRCVSQSLCWSHSPVGHRDHSHHKYSPNLNISASPGTAPHHISNDIRAPLGLNGSSQAWGEDNNGTRKRRKTHSMSESSLESHSWKWQSVLTSFRMGMGVLDSWFINFAACIERSLVEKSWSLETGYLESKLQPAILFPSTSCIVGAHVNKSGEDGSFARQGKSLSKHKILIVVRCGTWYCTRCWTASFLSFVWNIWCWWLRQWHVHLCKMHLGFFCFFLYLRM